MIIKMEKSEGIQVMKDVTTLAAVASNKKTADDYSDARRFSRERNLLLLSALHKLYGEDWKTTPDWSKVAEEIHNAKIPTFGEGFTSESCEMQYKSLIEMGYHVGILGIATRLKVPKKLRLTEAQKRLWILACTANDLVETSRIMDKHMRVTYKRDCAAIESGTVEQELTKRPEVVEAASDEELDNEDDAEVDLEAVQSQLSEAVVGMKDVLLLMKYCNDAADYAVEKYQTLRKLTPPAPPSPKKPEKSVEFNKSTVSTIQVSQELSNLVHSAIANTSEDDKQKNNAAASAAPAPTLSKLLELPVTTPGMPLPEIPSIKQDTSEEIESPKHNILKSPEIAVEDVALKTENCPIDNGEKLPSLPSSPVKQSPPLDTNGQDPVPIVSAADKSPCKSEPIPDKPSVENSPTKIADVQITEKVVVIDVETKVNTNDTSKSSPVKNTVDTDVLVTEDTENTVSSGSSSEVNETVDSTRQESPTKGKQTTKKVSSTVRPISTRTSSRLTSPEPTEQPLKEEDKSPKKTPSRPAPSNESHTPTLRSRRGATPTKAVTVEIEPIKSSTIVPCKLDFTEENEDETSETPRSTPESPEVKSDVESIIETKPPKQLKVYSAKPPSPLSHVDPKLFDAFIDDEDDPELAMIDSNINKSKTDKTLSKTYSRRGRTVSSETASDAGNNDDSAQTKRISKKVDEVEEVEVVGNNDDSASKRLTRSSLKLHDAANDEGTDLPQTESEKAASESSFSGKEKKPRNSKSMVRLKNLQEEVTRFYGEGDETPEGKRLTRARAKTTVTQPEKRSKPPSVGDSEGLSESEPTPTRATRSRSSTASSMPVLEPTASQQPHTTIVDDEEQKTFKKNALVFLEKLMAGDNVVQFQKHLLEDPSKVLKRQMDFNTVKHKIESGKYQNCSAIHSDLLSLALNATMGNPNSREVMNAVGLYVSSLRLSIEEFQNQRNASKEKNDNSDVESLESHDEQRSEASSKQASGGGRRKRKRSASETSEEVLPQENKRRVTRTSTSSAFQQTSRKPKHPISPDIVYAANRVRH